MNLVLQYEETALEVMDWLGIHCPDDLVIGPRRLLKQSDAVSENWVAKYLEQKQEQENNKLCTFPNTSWNYGTSHGNNS